MNTIFDFSCLAGLPVALEVAVEDHVDALEDEALGLVLEGEDALQPQDLRPVPLCHGR